MDIIGADQLKEFSKLDQVSREEWRAFAVDFVLQTCGDPETLEKLIAAGKFKFLGDAKRAFHGHAFKETDFVWMWEQLRRANAVIQLDHKRRAPVTIH